jgi:hypothetical protein
MPGQELIAAGGTGQEVAAAVLRLGYLAGLDVPNVTVFDSDVAPRAAAQEAMTRTETLQQLQRDLRSFGPLDQDRLFFINPAVLPGASGAVQHVRDLFSSHGRVGVDDQALLDLLLDREQQETTISDGFHGQPALGSLIFSSALTRGAFQPFLDGLRSRATAQDGLRVVFAASLAGGVGTSVIPVLLQELARLRRDQKDSSRLKLLATFQVPWFRLRQFDDDGFSRAPNVSQTLFERNTACLLQGYLSQSIARDVDAIVLLGLPQPVERISHGAQQQLETKHYLCLMAGMQALNLLDPSSTERMLGSSWTGFHAASLQSSPGHLAYDGPPPGPALYLGNGRSLSVRRLVYLASALLAVTRALLFEAGSERPAATHHLPVANTLRGLSGPAERTSFRQTLEGLDALHRQIHRWLEDSVRSMAGKNRADTLGVFVPQEDWAELFDPGEAAALKRLGARFRLISSGRKLLRRIGPLRPPGSGATGREAAWSLVQQARKRLLETL